MTTRLERHEHSCAARALAGILERKHFRVRLAGTLVPAFADDFIAMCNHAADARIGLRGEQAAYGQAQGARHHYVIGGGEFAQASPTSGAARRRLPETGEGNL
jgi:hypothetical protein